MSYDENTIRKILEKRILPEFNETIDDVMKTVELVNGMYVFVINSDGYAFVDNDKSRKHFQGYGRYYWTFGDAAAQ